MPRQSADVPACEVSRRDFVRLVQWQLLALPIVQFGAGSKALAAEAPYLNRFGRMVHDYFLQKVREASDHNRRAKQRLQSKQDVEQYITSVREKIRTCFGPEPERTPLNPRVMGVLDRDGYRVEKVIFESRPHFPITANLYIPTNRPLPAPAVLGPCGHFAEAKAAEQYQSFAQGLARLGYVCLIYDPIGQGERIQYTTTELKSRVGPGAREHIYAGSQQFLVDEFFGMWRAWDGIRALDYLISRPEVDSTKIGITGNSGGGTMTTWLCGLDRRITMAAPNCFVTTFRRNFENELPADTEQCPPKALALGLDQEDFLLAMAPRPVIILGQELDFFDIRGTEEAYQRMRDVYALLDASEEVKLFIGPLGHGYTKESREPMYGWFNRAIGGPQVTAEPRLKIEEAEDLWCTANGHVSSLGNAKRVCDFTREKSLALREQRPKLERESLCQALREALNLPESPPTPPDYRVLRSHKPEGYPAPHTVDYAVETEPSIQAIVYMLSQTKRDSRPPQGKRATLYISHLSSDADLREEPLLRELAATESAGPLFTCDVRGSGESQPTTCGGSEAFGKPWGSDYFYASYSIMLDRPYLGQKTFDVLRVLDWLKSFGYDDIHLVAKGRGTLAATFAALFAASVKKVTLKNNLTSYADVAESEEYSWPISTLLPKVLTRFDLPDCYAALQEKDLRIIEPWGALAKTT